MSGLGGHTGKANLHVPPPNNALNTFINQLIGNRNDYNETATIFGFLHDLWEERHSAQLVYPVLAQGALITSHLDAWALGNFAEVVPANAITRGFHIHHLCLCTASANGDYEIRLYRGTTPIGQVTFSRTDKKDDISGLDIFTSHCDPNTQIQAKIASSNAAQQDTIRLKVWYHPHLHS